MQFHKGEFCLWKPVICQEGYCDNCYIKEKTRDREITGEESKGMDNNTYIYIMKKIRMELEKEIGKKLTDEQWKAISDEAYRLGHEQGYADICIAARNLQELVVKLLRV